MAKHKGRAKKAKTISKAQLKREAVAAKKVEAEQATERAKAAEAEAEATRQRLLALGLRELVIKNCPYRLLVLADADAVPTMEQRLMIARRINDVGPKLPQYIPKGALMKRSIPGITNAELQKVFDQNQKDEAERQKKLAQEAKKKEKEEAAKIKAAAAQRKKTKSVDVTPKVSPELAKKVAAKQAKEKAAKATITKSEKKPATATAKGKKFDVPKVPAGGFNKTNKPATSGELIRARIMEHKMTDAQIAAEVRKLFEGRNTSETDVRWNRGQMRVRGMKAPDPVGGEPQKTRK